MRKAETYIWLLLGALLVAWGIWNASGACSANGLDTAFNLAPYIAGFAIWFWQGWRHIKRTLFRVLFVLSLLVLAAIGLFAMFLLNFGNCYTF